MEIVEASAYIKTKGHKGFIKYNWDEYTKLSLRMISKKSDEWRDKRRIITTRIWSGKAPDGTELYATDIEFKDYGKNDSYEITTNDMRKMIKKG